MPCFKVFVTCFDKESNKWIPLHEEWCFAQFSSSPVILLKDHEMNHIKTVNLSSQFSYVKQSAKNYAIVSSSSAYGFVVCNDGEVQVFENYLESLKQQPCPKVPDASGGGNDIFKRQNQFYSSCPRARHWSPNHPPPVHPNNINEKIEFNHFQTAAVKERSYGGDINKGTHDGGNRPRKRSPVPVPVIPQNDYYQIRETNERPPVPVPVIPQYDYYQIDKFDEGPPAPMIPQNDYYQIYDYDYIGPPLQGNHGNRPSQYHTNDKRGLNRAHTVPPVPSKPKHFDGTHDGGDRFLQNRDSGKCGINQRPPVPMMPQFQGNHGNKPSQYHNNKRGFNQAQNAPPVPSKPKTFNDVQNIRDLRLPQNNNQRKPINVPQLPDYFGNYPKGNDMIDGDVEVDPVETRPPKKWDGWRCNTCTFENPSTFANCKVCMTPRPVAYKGLNNQAVPNIFIPKDIQLVPVHNKLPGDNRTNVVVDDGFKGLNNQPAPNMFIPNDIQVVPVNNNLPLNQANVKFDEGWNCKTCTLRNTELSANCNACFAPRHNINIINKMQDIPDQHPPVREIPLANKPPTPDKVGWECTYCTLKNPPSYEGCVACTGARPDNYKIPEHYDLWPEEKKRVDEKRDKELHLEAEKLQIVELSKAVGFPNSLLPYPRAFQCPLCNEHIAENGTIFCDCLHCFCENCLKKKIMASDDYEVKCPYDKIPQCDSIISMFDIKMLIPHDEYGKFLDRTANAAKLGDIEIFHCRTANCNGWCSLDDGDMFICPLCAVVNCITCKANHPNQTCEAYQETIKKFPVAWVNEGQIEDEVLVELTPNSAEWRNVEDFFNDKLQNNCVVQKIERCQNKKLWEKYEMQKKVMAEHNGKENVNEKLLFHGSKANPPIVIWKGVDGFDMRYSPGGMWGRGSYFAENSQYSLNYSYLLEGKNRQMFVAKVLTGLSTELAPDRTLTMPPVRETKADGVKVLYDSVSGVTEGCKIYIVYKFDVAYPNYLLTYQVQ